jgi:tetratricopeptide (TPR) repeat protein
MGWLGVASSLALKLTGEEASRLQKKPTADKQAFQLYLRGRYFWDRRTKEDLGKALGYFNDAIRHDPQFALAYAGVAQCYAPSIYLGVRRRDDATIGEMRHFVGRALELDPDMADAYVSQASLRLLEWDWAGSEQSFHRAIALNPNDTLAHLWYGFLLDALGRQEENLAERRRALELDPLSWSANAGVGWALGALGRHDEAIQHLRAAMELNPTFTLPAKTWEGIRHDRQARSRGARIPGGAGSAVAWIRLCPMRSKGGSSARPGANAAEPDHQFVRCCDCERGPGAHGRGSRWAGAGLS